MTSFFFNLHNYLDSTLIWHLRVHRKLSSSNSPGSLFGFNHGLRMPREEIAFTAWPKYQSQSQIFRQAQSIFCLPHRPNFSDIFDLCLYWVSVVRGFNTGIRSHSRSDESSFFFKGVLIPHAWYGGICCLTSPKGLFLSTLKTGETM